MHRPTCEQVTEFCFAVVLVSKYAVSSVRWMVLNISLQFSLWILCIQVLKEHPSPSRQILHNLGVVPVAWGSGCMFNFSCVVLNDLKCPRPLGLLGPLIQRLWFPKVTPRLRRNSWLFLNFCVLVTAISSFPHFILVVTTAPPHLFPKHHSAQVVVHKRLTEGLGITRGISALATHSSILAWRIPWTEEPGGLQYTGSQRVGHDWVTLPTYLSPGQKIEVSRSSMVLFNTGNLSLCFLLRYCLLPFCSDFLLLHLFSEFHRSKSL